MSESEAQPLLKWSQLPNFANGRHGIGSAFVQVGNQIYLIGSQRRLAVLHLNTWVWEELLWNTHSFSLQHATLVDDKIYMIAPDVKQNFYSMVVEFDPVLGTFRQRSVNRIPNLRARPVFADWRREMIIFGGHVVHKPRGPYDAPYNYRGRMVALDVDTMQFRTLEFKGIAPTPREDAATALVGRQMYVFGGKSPLGRFNDLWIADLRFHGSPTWSAPRLSGVFPSPVAQATLNEVNGKLILFGGVWFEGASKHELWMYCPRTREWKSPLKRDLLVQGRCPRQVIGCNGLRANGAILYVSAGGLCKLELQEIRTET